MGRSNARRSSTTKALTPARLAAALDHHLPAPGQRIGLLGGSFNPAHPAHREISLAALRRLDLDEVWWLVSPQNPLKPSDGMAELSKRVGKARLETHHPKIRVAAIESVLQTTYTAETLAALRKRFPRVHFIWLMGADNLFQIQKWKNWSKIFHTVAVAVFDRPTYALRACAALPARRFARCRHPERTSQGLWRKSPPAWVFIHNRLNPLSATQIRAQGETDSPGA